jgi:hypothetical protein
VPEAIEGAQRRAHELYSLSQLSLRTVSRRLVLHDMTIDTCFSVVGHVRVAARIDECVGADTQCNTECHAENYTRH